MKLSIQTQRDTDGRFIAECPEVPGVLVYGDSEEEAKRSAKERAFDVLAGLIASRKIAIVPMVSPSASQAPVPLVSARLLQRED